MSRPDDRSDELRTTRPPASALPVDSDVDTMPGSVMAPRPLHLRPRFIVAVGIGGAFGTLARYLLGLVIPQVWGLPWPTLTVNLLGAFLLGALLEGLGRRGTDDGRRRALRLMLGTGFMGGFTTYSSLAVESAQLLRTDRVWEAVGYGLITLIVGLLASLFGMWVAAVHHRSVVRKAHVTAEKSTAEASTGQTSTGAAS